MHSYCLQRIVRTTWLCLTFFYVLGVAYKVQAANDDSSGGGGTFYADKIKPLLLEKCATCHGMLAAESGLRLDAIQFIRAGGDSGSILAAIGDGESVLLERVAAVDPSLRMPPEGEGAPLTNEQLQWLSEWILAGAPGPEDEAYLSGPEDHWAFQPIVRPQARQMVGAATAIDQWITLQQQAVGLTALDRANDASWLRRVSLDLIGIPPSVQELGDFLSDASSDRKQKIVDRLLGDSAYGQRWGRHWMDIWRYSDWDGYKNELRGSQRHIWHWRDWIVESLNSNKSYAQMITEMLAGDELTPSDLDTLRATGFLARNFHKSNRNIWLEAVVEHTGKAFLGLTLNCAKCHDHKYDPISQRNYYEFRAIFEPHQVRTDQLPGEPDILKAGVPRAYDAVLDVETFVYRRGDDRHPDKANPVAPAVLDWVPVGFQITPVQLPLDSYVPALSRIGRQNSLHGKLQAIHSAMNALRQWLDSFQPVQTLEEGPVLLQRTLSEQELSLKFRLAVADYDSVLARQAADLAKYQNKTAEEQSRLALSAARAEHHHTRSTAELNLCQQQLALHAAETADEKDQTKKAATLKSARDSLVEAQNKLQEIPLVPSSDAKEYTPVGELLAQQSTGRRTALARWITDSRNPLTARVAVNHIWTRHFGRPLVDNVFDFGLNTPPPKLLSVLNWLAAELIDSDWNMKHMHRLIVLSEAYGRLSNSHEPQTRNESIDPDNELLWRFNLQRLDSEQVRDSILAVAGELDVSQSGPDIDYELGETIPRRTLYFRHAYEKQMQMMLLFDAASPTECYLRKPSIIPQQALVLINSPLARSMSRRLTANLLRSLPENNAAEFTRQLFLSTLQRPPTDEELLNCVEFVSRQKDLLANPETLTQFGGSEKAKTLASPSPLVRALESLTLVMLNHNDFLTIR